MSNHSPIACDLSAFGSEALGKHKEVSKTVLGSVTEIRGRPDGYAFRLPSETEMIRQAATFVARERQCCPFFDFTNEVGRDDGPVWLSVSGREGVKPYVEDSVLPTIQAAKEK
jgi:hypothetical protein